MNATTVSAAARRMISSAHRIVVSSVWTIVGAAVAIGLLIVPASAQLRTGGLRNETSIRVGHVWQHFMIEGLFSPDQTVFDRTDQSLGFHFTHVFGEIQQDDPLRSDRGLAEMRAGRFTVDVSKGPLHVTEPDELRAEISTSGMVAPFLALGGRVTYVRLDGALYENWNREFIPELASAAMFAAVADFWISRRVVLSGSVGAGRYSREGVAYHNLDDGMMLCFGHELRWSIDRTFSYDHTVRVENWEDYRSTIDIVNRLNACLLPELTCGAGIRISDYFTREYTDETTVGYLLYIRYQPVPWLYAELSTTAFSAAIVDDKDQQELQLALGTRF